MSGSMLASTGVRPTTNTTAITARLRSSRTRVLFPLLRGLLAGRPDKLRQPPNRHQRDEDAEKRCVGQLGVGLQQNEERSHQRLTQARAGSHAAQRVEHREGDPLRAGDVELAQRGVEQLARRERIQQPAQKRGAFHDQPQLAASGVTHRPQHLQTEQDTRRSR